MIFDDLITQFQSHADEQQAVKMKAYMKNQFEFFGLPAPKRREIARDWKNNENYKVQKADIHDLKLLFTYPKRECAYSAQEWLVSWVTKFASDKDLSIITSFLTTQSWWDTVDLLSSNVLGNFMKQYPAQISIMVKQYDESQNMWLQRATLLFQLKYKEKTDEKLLYTQCLKYKNSKEFFLQKAMGWALREYAKTNPKSVYQFVDAHDFPPLTVREACKHRK